MVSTTPKKVKRGVHRFITLINYYYNMRAMRYHKVQTFTNLTSKNVTFLWNYVEQEDLLWN